MKRLNLLKLIITRVVLIVALFPALLMTSLIVREGAIEIYGRLFFRNTYIDVIDTPSYGKYTKEFLQEFNSFADNKIISFNKIKGGRPITIREMGGFYESLYPGVIGVARPRFNSCSILVKKGLDLIDYRETLLHEYLHCMGYNHVANRDDLMYYSLNPVDKEENIKQYAKKVLKKFYE